MLSTVGIHYAGWFRASGEDFAAADALRYGLLNAQLALGNPRKIDFDTLFTKRLSEVIAAANEALALSESPCRIEEIVFARLLPKLKTDSLIHDACANIMFVTNENRVHAQRFHRSKHGVRFVPRAFDTAADIPEIPIRFIGKSIDFNIVRS